MKVEMSDQQQIQGPRLSAVCARRRSSHALSHALTTLAASCLGPVLTYQKPATPALVPAEHAVACQGGNRLKPPVSMHAPLRRRADSATPWPWASRRLTRPILLFSAMSGHKLGNARRRGLLSCSAARPSDAWAAA